MNVRKEIDVDRLRTIFDEDPRKKKEVQEILDIDRQTISKILTRARRIEGGELLTIAEICEIDPRELALK